MTEEAQKRRIGRRLPRRLGGGYLATYETLWKYARAYQQAHRIAPNQGPHPI